MLSFHKVSSAPPWSLYSTVSAEGQIHISYVTYGNAFPSKRSTLVFLAGSSPFRDTLEEGVCGARRDAGRHKAKGSCTGPMWSMWTWAGAFGSSSSVYTSP